MLIPLWPQPAKTGAHNGIRDASGRKKREGAAQITGISCADLPGKYGHAHARREFPAVARRFARSYKQYQARTFSESELAG